MNGPYRWISTRAWPDAAARILLAIIKLAAPPSCSLWMAFGLASPSTQPPVWPVAYASMPVLLMPSNQFLWPRKNHRKTTPQSGDAAEVYVTVALHTKSGDCTLRFFQQAFPGLFIEQFYTK